MRKLYKILSIVLVLVLLFPSATFASASDAAVEETEVTRVEEVVELRETNSETYLMSDGTYECVIYTEDKYFDDGTDTLKLIDNTIKAADASTLSNPIYTNTAGFFDVTFGASGTPNVTIALNENSVSFSPLGASGGTGNHLVADDYAVLIGKVENNAALDHLTATGSNTITYSNAFAGADLVYVLANQGLKEYIVLNSSSSPNAFSFLFELDGLTLQSEDGYHYFADASGNAVFSLGSLFAVDANGKPTDALTYSFVPVKGNADQVIVTVTLSEDYLAAPDRAYPVVIDPTITVSSSETADTCVCEYFPSTNYYLGTTLRTGYDSDYGRRRSYLRFNIPDSIEPGSITNATLDLEKVSGVAPTVVAKMVTGSWTSSTLTWSNKPGETSTGQSSQSVVFREGSAWYTMNVTSIVNSWVNGYSLNYGFVLIDNTENNANHWTTFYSSDAVSPHKPELIISYSGSAVITPPPSDPECTYLALNNYVTSMQIGQSIGFTVNTNPAGVAVTWTSSNINVATVNAAGVVTAHDIGYATITASSGEQSDSRTVEVVPVGDYQYDITVSNYYDNGFNNNYSSIQDANNNAAKRLARIFQLRLASGYYPYTSVADTCKAMRHPNSDCPMDPHCYSPESLRAQFVFDKGNGTDTHSKVLWSSHEAALSDSSDSDQFGKTIVIIPMTHMNHSKSYQFIHELAHQLGTLDHYCERNGNPCGNNNCDICVRNLGTERACVMTNETGFTERSDQTWFCSECMGIINTHLSDHH